MSVRELALLAALGGCNAVWGLSEVDANTSVAIDAADPLSNQCLFSFPSDDFLSQPPCVGVGVPDGPGTDSLDPDLGDLLVGLPGTGLHQGGCISHAVVAFGPGGVFANVKEIATGNDYNVLDVHWADNVNTTAIIAGPTGLALAHVIKPATTAPALGAAPLAPWWRIRPSPDRSAILGESSLDGTHWVQFGIDPVPAPAMAYLELAIGSFDDEPMGQPSNARISSINVCP